MPSVSSAQAPPESAATPSALTSRISPAMRFDAGSIRETVKSGFTTQTARGVTLMW